MSAARTPYVCASCSRSLSAITPRALTSVTRTAFFSSTSRTRQDEPQSVSPSTTTTTYTPPHVVSSSYSQDLPRWKQTPPGMRQPLRLRPQPRQPLWKVNTEQEPLDEMYDRLIGRTLGGGIVGRDALPEDVKVSFQGTLPFPQEKTERIKSSGPKTRIR